MHVLKVYSFSCLLTSLSGHVFVSDHKFIEYQGLGFIIWFMNASMASHIYRSSMGDCIDGYYNDG